ncbi:MAG: hypothetical protein ABEH81_16600, partial [Halopenitus sp.]
QICGRKPKPSRRLLRRRVPPTESKQLSRFLKTGGDTQREIACTTENDTEIAQNTELKGELTTVRDTYEAAECQGTSESNER